MASRLARALRRMTAPSTLTWWRPEAFDALMSLEMADAPASDEDVRRRDGSSADLRERQRALAFDMSGEALMRLADEDDAEHAQERRETA